MLPALQIDRLAKSYDGEPAVRDLSLSIQPGEIFGLLGPNGAGKSSTITMVVGVTRIDRGQVQVFGYDNRRDYRVTRRLIGVMHQEIVIDHFFTIDRALRIHAGYYGASSDNAWRELLIERLGLGPHLHKPMNKLSGGLKRRLMVAKALIHRPRLLILDEPTAGVDVELRHSLWDFVREINGEGTTVVLTTHYLEEAEALCGRIAIMNRGDLVALETKNDLLRRLDRRRVLIRLRSPLEGVPSPLRPYLGTLSEEGRSLALSLPREMDDGELISLLCPLGLPISELQTEKTGLEEVFLELTGVRPNGRESRP